MVEVLYQGRKRKVHTGSRGGKYVVVQGTKRYLKAKKSASKKKPVKKATKKCVGCKNMKCVCIPKKKKVVKRKPQKKKKPAKRKIMKGGTSYNLLHKKYKTFGDLATKYFPGINFKLYTEKEGDYIYTNTPGYTTSLPVYVAGTACPQVIYMEIEREFSTNRAKLIPGPNAGPDIEENNRYLFNYPIHNSTGLSLIEHPEIQQYLFLSLLYRTTKNPRNPKLIDMEYVGESRLKQFLGDETYDEKIKPLLAQTTTTYIESHSFVQYIADMSSVDDELEIIKEEVLQKMNATALSAQRHGFVTSSINSNLNRLLDLAQQDNYEDAIQMINQLTETIRTGQDSNKNTKLQTLSSLRATFTTGLREKKRAQENGQWEVDLSGLFDNKEEYKQYKINLSGHMTLKRAQEILDLPTKHPSLRLRTRAQIIVNLHVAKGDAPQALYKPVKTRTGRTQ